jgi:ribosomal protein S18 acetylase RimI-like enzyme
VGEASWAALPPALDEAAAAILADCAALGSVEAAGAAIAATRQDANGEIYGWIEENALIAVYGLQSRGLNFELLWLAVAPDWRGRRYGRSALVDALRRCGRKPMTVEVDEVVKDWFQRVGFKTVGRRPTAGGGHRFRLGWYAPRRPNEAGYGAH